MFFAVQRRLVVLAHAVPTVLSRRLFSVWRRYLMSSWGFLRQQGTTVRAERRLWPRLHRNISKIKSIRQREL